MRTHHVLLSLVAVAACGGAPQPVQRVHDLATDVLRGVRPDVPGGDPLFSFDSGDVVETFGSTAGHFVIHFTRAGRHAARAADTDASGVPDYVERTAATLEEVHAFFHAQKGFREPLPDADGRMDVYLLDFGGSADGAFRVDTCGGGGNHAHRCSGYLVMENDFTGYGYPSITAAIQTLTSHEYFHAIQAAYHANLGSVVGEGTAVWATEKYAPQLDDLEHFLPGFVVNLARSLDRPLPGPVDPFSYGSALFFVHLDESLGEGTLRELYEAADAKAAAGMEATFLELVEQVAVAHGTDFNAVFRRFTSWNAQMGSAARAGEGYAASARYPYPPVVAAAHPSVVAPDRLFHASAQYFLLDAPGTPVAVHMRPLEGHPVVPESRWLLMTLDTLGADVLAEGATLETREVPTTAGRTLALVVFNSARGGSSARLEVCLDAPGALCGAVQAPDAGPGDVGNGGNGGDGSGGDGGVRPPGCQQAGLSPVVLAAGVVLVMLRARRRG